MYVECHALFAAGRIGFGLFAAGRIGFGLIDPPHHPSTAAIDPSDFAQAGCSSKQGPGTSPWKPFDSRIVFNNGVDYGHAKTYGTAIHCISLKDKVVGQHLSKEGVKVTVNGDIVVSFTGREGYFACFLGKDNSLYSDLELSLGR